MMTDGCLCGALRFQRQPAIVNRQSERCLDSIDSHKRHVGAAALSRLPTADLRQHQPHQIEGLGDAAQTDFAASKIAEPAGLVKD